MASIILPYDHFWSLVTRQGLDMDDAQIRIRLVTSGYTYSDAHTQWDDGTDGASDPSAHEVSSGDGYATGGIQLVNPVGDVDSLSFDDVIWTSLTKTFRAAIGVAIGTYGGVVDPVLFYLLPDSTPADIVSNGSNYEIQWHDTDGLIYRPAP